jgi:hypothetical protein
MAHEELISDLEVIDFLELFNSTVKSADLLGISQSSCSRRYRSFSENFGIGFDRTSDCYRASSNFDVLSNLRQASQKLRIRHKQPRITIGWSLGNIPMTNFSDMGNVLPMRPMSSWRMLSLLEQRLVDFSIMGLMEFQSLLNQPLARLLPKLVSLGQNMLCVPIFQFELKLISSSNHPLQGVCDLKHDQLAQYSSPALPLGMAPVLMGALQAQGLATQPCGLIEYDESSWEGFASNGQSLSYSAPHQLAQLSNKYNLELLGYDLGIQECIGIVGHRDVLSDPVFPKLFRQSLSCLKTNSNRLSNGIRWLC